MMTSFTAEDARWLTMDPIEFRARLLSRFEAGSDRHWGDFTYRAWLSMLRHVQ